MQPSAPFTPSAGLCETCANVRIVQSGKGSRFYLCRLSSIDAAFAKYPRLPVIRCRGYTPADAPVSTEPGG